MYTRMMLMVVFWRCRMPFDTHGWEFTLMTITFHAKILTEGDKSIDGYRFIKINAFSRLRV